MSKQVYDWERFWCPRSGRINLADGGYLCDPKEKWGKVHNPDLVIFETISQLPCLGLLGEPGIGKTQALEGEKNKIIGKIEGQGDQVLFLNLRSFGSEDRLVSKLFESPKFEAFQTGTHRLHIFLDSFDECLLQIHKLAPLLVDEFKYYKNAVDRLCLRIACRTAIWQPLLEEGLKEIWGKNSVGIYELAPLRRIDVIKAAEAKGFSPNNFLKEVNQKNIVPLAIKPITLEFLLNTYHRHGDKFPPNQKLDELYLDGCRCLCEEHNKSRWASKRLGNLDVNQRLIVGARIAAITIFANRFAVWTGSDLGNVPPEDVLLQKLCHGYETANGRKFDITTEVIEEVLDTGLFSSRGLHRMGWAHQTYAEFLAAWYLVQHEMPLAQITGLIFSSEEPDCKLILQLHETAAWIASMRIDVLKKIIETDPDVLLRSDIPTDSDLREAIVTSLLTQYEQEKLYDDEGNQYSNYGKLKHPGLAAQLRPYIQNSTKQIDARNTAIEIAEVCEVSELQEELVNLALDSSQSIHLRVSAANAICSIGDENARLKLKPLAVEQLPEDEYDELKGYALRALWSELLTAEELFSVLTRPKKENFFGSYRKFIDLELVSKLQPDDLVVALNWLGNQGVRCFRHPFEKLGDQILLKAWEYFDFPGMAEGFTKITIIQLRECQQIITHNDEIQTQFASSLINNTEKRRKLIEQVVSMISSLEEEKSPLLGSLVSTTSLQGDVFWMLDKLQNTNSEKAQHIWSRLIQCNFNRQDVNQIDAILLATQTNNILQEIFASDFSPIELNSVQADKLRDDYRRMQEMQEMQERRQNPPLLDPPPRERVLQLLEKLESGDLSAWWQLNMEMTLKPNSTHYDNEFELDLTKLPGWQEAEEATQKRIIESAKNYIQNQDNVAYEWIGTNKYNRPALAGCRAFQLLLKESPEFLDNLSSEIWKKWTPVIIATPIINRHEDSYLEIVKCAYVNAPQESINTLITLIDKENQEHGHIVVISRFDKCWDQRLKLALLEKAKDPTLKPKYFEQLLKELLKQEKLLKQGLTEVRDFAKSLISFPLPLAENEWEKVLTASRVLIQNLDSSSWSFIWSLIEQDSFFGREVLGYGIQLIELTETQLADLYLWLVRQYPHDEDHDYNNEVGAHYVTNRESIAWLKNRVLNQLKERGTSQADTEVKRLIQELPSITWRTRTLIDTQVNRLRKTWQPHQPEQILKLVINQEKRLVQNGQHLLEVLVESLKRLESELQGETPAVRDLWDKVNSSFRPLDENALSDYIKRFLDRDLRSRGIIANREVELRRSYGGNPGERTDIHVDAVLKGTNGEVYDSITVIIEVKGCWHSELKTAMQNQLVERYLSDNASRYGLYLVGWFNCQQWDNEDSRRKKAPDMSLDEARAQFNAKAEELSSSGNMVRAYVLNTALR